MRETVLVFLKFSARITVILLTTLALASSSSGLDLTAIKSPIILHGSPTNSYRDPVVIYHDGTFRLFCTLNRGWPGKAATNALPK
ncbi:MAG: hypothetical protein ABSF60_14430 [Verrucomicrobiota bacterium]|jgi:hypothetical protein